MEHDCSFAEIVALVLSGKITGGAGRGKSDPMSRAYPPIFSEQSQRAGQTPHISFTALALLKTGAPRQNLISVSYSHHICKAGIHSEFTALGAVCNWSDSKPMRCRHANGINEPRFFLRSADLERNRAFRFRYSATVAGRNGKHGDDRNDFSGSA